LISSADFGDNAGMSGNIHNSSGDARRTDHSRQSQDIPCARIFTNIIGSFFEELLRDIYELPSKLFYKKGELRDLIEDITKLLSEASKRTNLENLCEQGESILSDVYEIRKALSSDNGDHGSDFCAHSYGNCSRLLQMFKAGSFQPLGVVKSDLADFFDSAFNPSGDEKALRNVTGKEALSSFLAMTYLRDIRQGIFQTCALSVFRNEQAALSRLELLQILNANSYRREDLQSLRALGGSPMGLATLSDSTSGSLIPCFLVPNEAFERFGNIIKTRIEEAINSLGWPHRDEGWQPALWYQEGTDMTAVGIRIPITDNPDELSSSSPDINPDTIQYVKIADGLAHQSLSVELVPGQTAVTIKLPLEFAGGRDLQSLRVFGLAESAGPGPLVDARLVIDPFQAENGSKKYSIKWQLNRPAIEYSTELYMLRDSDKLRRALSRFFSPDYTLISFEFQPGAIPDIGSHLAELANSISFGNLDGFRRLPNQYLQAQFITATNPLPNEIKSLKGGGLSATNSEKPFLFLKWAKNTEALAFLLTARDMSFLAIGRLIDEEGHELLKATLLPENFATASVKIIDALSEALPNLIRKDKFNLSALKYILSTSGAKCDDNFIEWLYDKFMNAQFIPTKFDIADLLFSYILNKQELPTGEQIS
jgi:hypothetical protein